MCNCAIKKERSSKIVLSQTGFPFVETTTVCPICGDTEIKETLAIEDDGRDHCENDRNF